MRKVKSSILIGLACISILSLLTGIQTVKASSEVPLNQSQVMD